MVSHTTDACQEQCLHCSGTSCEGPLCEVVTAAGTMSSPMAGETQGSADCCLVQAA